MVLPSTGNEISFNQIRIELLVPGATGFNLGDAASGVYNVIQNCQSPFPNATDPDSMSEWWAYDHSKTGSFFAEGKTADSCFNVCNAAVSCNATVYNFNSTYYIGDTSCRSSNLANTFFAAPTACSGGTFSGQTCYEFSGGVIVSTTTCVLCSPLGDPCIDGSTCCSGACCDGYCATEAC
jgi:hypothetical protein